MKENNALLEKTYAFALRIVGLYRYMTKEKKEFVLSKQVLRSGTSVGANAEEAVGAQSEKDFFPNSAFPIKKQEKRIIG